ncbi:TPA: hypothetical protein N0F65_009352 [Lagenidium giganteum]|uniref:Uncharacterized protein n=1 Tax=Lagenidium giganteum TaxID=4803 RepID=A0AAV2ZDE3_9STRA|nr:TPA: hypothetical protein N0F65_009352 [Lagenidium giganteum]
MASTPPDELRLLKVYDKATGVCVFCKQWKWDTQAHAEGVDSLVQSFTQFAREIDGGDVVQIHFQANTQSNNLFRSDEERRHNSSSSNLMLSLSDEMFNGVLFHDRTTESRTAALRVFLQCVVQKFQRHLQADITQINVQLPFEDKHSSTTVSNGTMNSSESNSSSQTPEEVVCCS